MVVVGGGFGGLSVVRALRHAPVDITLIDRHSYNTFQPLLYQVATAALNPGDVTWFLRSLRFKQRNLRFINATVEAMDHSTRSISLSNGHSPTYDELVIAAGVTANYFGIPGAAEHAMPLYTRTQAIAVRDAMFTSLERAAARDDHGELRVIVVGGGATGVETAGALAELRNQDMAVTYPELDPASTHITLMEMLPNLLAPFDGRLQWYAKAALERRGVDIRLGTAVKEVRADGVVDDEGNFIPAGIVIWASGITVDDRVDRWDVPRGHGGRIVVDDRLRVEGVDHVHAIGDIALMGDRGLPQLAQPAIQGGKYVGKALASGMSSHALPPFHYRDKGSLATIGRSSAVAEIPRLPGITGFPAWLLWMGVHITYLLGARNRLATIVNLGFRYLFSRRGHSAIVGETQPSPERDQTRTDT